MVRNSQAARFRDSVQEHSLAEALRRSRAGNKIRRDLAFLLEFNRNLEINAKLSRLNEEYLDQRMEELDRHIPLCTEAYEQTRARLHELLLLCAANYANNCEYAAVGDLMFNPRLILVHIRGRHQPVVKLRHTPLTEQFQDRERSPLDVRMRLRNEAALEIKKKPLIPHSYRVLETCGFIPRDYLNSARDREVQIADLSAFLCSKGFEDRSELEDWIRRAGPGDRALVESRLLPLDWGIFQRLGYCIKPVVEHVLRRSVLRIYPPPGEPPASGLFPKIS